MLFSSYSSSLLFFFFYSYAHHRDLHSFPTRRSSDLCALEPPPLDLDSAYDTLVMERWAAARASALPPWVLATFYRDRKSTRLNSSHQIISYAVFCLKKKKKIDIYSGYA